MANNAVGKLAQGGVMNNSKRAINAYGSISLEHQVGSASSHRLIVLLFDGAIKSINVAKFNLQIGNIAEKGMALSKAISIIEEGLRISLDKNAGGELAENLDALYEYAAYQLLQANLRNDELILDHVLALMTDLRESWISIDPVVSGANQDNSSSAEGAVVYGKV